MVTRPLMDSIASITRPSWRNGVGATNDMTALPAWLRRRNLPGPVGSIEARGCQVESARQRQDQGADDRRRVQANQPTFYRECVDVFAWLQRPQPRDQPVTLGYDEPVDGDHGQIASRRVWRAPSPAGLEACARWPGLPSAGMGDSIRPLGEAERVEQRYDS